MKINKSELEGLVTESASKYADLEKKSISTLLEEINIEDHSVAESVKRQLPQVEALVEALLPAFQQGGRLFYIGSGTSGRLGIVDVSEWPPTYGVSHDLGIGLIAGGDQAIRFAIENAEDDEAAAWEQLSDYQPAVNDTIVGISASGRTPYVIGGLKKANELGINTGCIVCNRNSPIAKEAKFPIEVVVGSEYVTGSTRMKAGTAQKLVLNMISTSLMIKLGHIKGNIMLDMQLTNEKLVVRAANVLTQELDISFDLAEELIQKTGSIRKAIEEFRR